MKGQTQPVVLMLTATVLVGTISSVYVWGEPLLSKGQGQAELQKLEQDVLELQNTIVDVSRAGEGTTETVNIGDSISTSSQFEIAVNDQKNYIQITETSESTPYPINTWTTIKGKNLQNTTIGRGGSYAFKGDDQPGVVAVNPKGTADESQLTYRIDFRNMYSNTPSGSILERTNLNTEGRSRTADSATLTITNEGTSWDRGSETVTTDSGEEFERKNTQINIDIR